jgi:hypothetical protein
MKILRKKLFTLPLSIFFLMLYSGVYLSAGHWHSHKKNHDEKSLAYSQQENCDYCKLISNETFEICSDELSFQKNEILFSSPFLLENIFSPSVLNPHNKAPPAQA